MKKLTTSQWILDIENSCPVPKSQMGQLFDLLQDEDEDNDDEDDIIMRKLFVDANINFWKTDKDELQLYVEFIMPDNIEYNLPFYSTTDNFNTVWYKHGIWWDDIKKINEVLVEKENNIYLKYVQYRKLKPFA